MDKFPNNTIVMERNLFLKRLKTNPVFLLRHLPSITNVLIQRLYIKKNKKPLWLKDIKSIPASHFKDFQNKLRLLSKRVVTTGFNNSSTFLINHSSDPEDYFAKHRWSELISDYLVPQHTFELPNSVNEWINQPPSKDNAAWETYSSCERIANLITWLTFCPLEKREEYITPQIFNFLETSMQWIFHHLEFYGKQTGNHILNNARAFIIGGVVLDNQTCFQIGMRILEHMLPILIQPQGSLRERSTHYQLLIMTWLLDILWFAEQSNFCSAKDLENLHQVVAKMLNVSANLCDTNGELSIFIGDISPDLSPELTTQRLKTCYPKDWPYQKIKKEYQYYDDWHILQREKDNVILNCPTGAYPQLIRTHAHGDISSFVWMHEQQPILIDCGRSRYIKDQISIHQKSAIGHNISLVNGYAPLCESLVITGHWWPLPYAKAHIHVESQAQQILIKHNGFHRATKVTEHVRTIRLAEEALTVSEEYTGKGQVIITSLWNFHPSFKQFNVKKQILANEEKSIFFNFIHAQTYFPIVKYFDHTKGLNWCSNQYGAAENHSMMTVTWIVNLPFTMTTIFRIKPCVA